MDNITHSLIGLAAGQFATRLRARHDPVGAEKNRLASWLVSAVANNIPDLDFLLTPLTGGILGYLLQHRGYTHTLLLAPVQSFFILMLAWLWARRSKIKWSAGDRNWLIGLALLGPVLHIAFDALNSYGVHPLWPFNDRWFYGDTLFILEPAIWVTLTPLLIRESNSRSGKTLFAALLALGLGACIFTGFVPWQLTLTLIAASAWLLGLMFKLKAGARATAAILACTMLVALFATASARARTDVMELVLKEFPGTRLHDIALTPYPANPLCWSLWTIESQRGWYFARHGIYAAAPNMLGASECPEFRTSPGTTFPLVPVPGPSRPELLWSVQFQAPLGELQRLAKDSCQTAALLRFARVPAWTKVAEGKTTIGDLRFDRGPGKGFARVTVPTKGADENCPAHVPSWDEPRRDLFIGD